MLKKREVFRQCFDNFDFDKIAEYTDVDVERILNTDSMIRSPRKVQAEDCKRLPDCEQAAGS